MLAEVQKQGIIRAQAPYRADKRPEGAVSARGFKKAFWTDQGGVQGRDSKSDHFLMASEIHSSGN